MPVLLEVTRVFTFDAAHRLEDYVGKCHDLHGHTYRLELTVRGPRDHRGIVVDFADLRRIFDRFYAAVLDHKYLNETLPTVNTTAENIAVWFFNYWADQVAPAYPGIVPERVVVWETPAACVSLTRADWLAGRDDDAAYPPARAADPDPCPVPPGR